jgi:hypothetical protein
MAYASSGIYVVGSYRQTNGNSATSHCKVCAPQHGMMTTAAAAAAAKRFRYTSLRSLTA